MSFYAELRGHTPKNKIDEDGYRDLAAAVVIKAIEDWRYLCYLCRKGGAYSFRDMSFDSLERWFKEEAWKFITDEALDLGAMYDELQAEKQRALRARAKKLAYGDDSFGHKLKKLRTQAGMTRKTLAQYTGYSNVQLSRYESGETLPSPQTQAKLLKAVEKYKNDNG